ncbi:hypothetical protein D3C87_853190 [compost metagenome]
MKIILILSIVLVFAARGCQEENEEGWQNETIDEVGYVAEDIKARQAIAEWQKFLTASDSAVFAARNQISRAVERIDDPRLQHKGKFKALIFTAETRIEDLSDKLLRADRFTIEEDNYDEETLHKMKQFQQETMQKREKLNETLKELKSSKFRKS